MFLFIDDYIKIKKRPLVILFDATEFNDSTDNFYNGYVKKI